MTVYRRSGRHREPLLALYLADGGSPLYAEVVEAAIAEGRLPPLVMVGVANGGVEDGVARRAQEYLLGHHRRRFAAHERLVLKEVLPWGEAKLSVRADRIGRVVGGCSNGAAWVLAIAHRHPSCFAAVLAFSMAGAPPDMTPLRLRPSMRHWMVVGTLEQGRDLTYAWAAALGVVGAQVRCHERVAGHDMRLWTGEAAQRPRRRHRTRRCRCR